jgi:hypothetical protein
MKIAVNKFRHQNQYGKDKMNRTSSSVVWCDRSRWIFDRHMMTTISHERQTKKAELLPFLDIINVKLLI